MSNALIHSSKTKTNSLASETKSNPLLTSKDFEVQQLESTISELTQENSWLKSFILVFQEKLADLEFVNFQDYEEGSIIGKGATSTVKEVCTKEKLGKRTEANRLSLASKDFWKKVKF